MIYFWINFWAFCIKHTIIIRNYNNLLIKAAATNWFLMPVILGSKNDIQHMLARKGWHRSLFWFFPIITYFLLLFYFQTLFLILDNLIFSISKRDFKTPHVNCDILYLLSFYLHLKKGSMTFINSILLWLIIIVTVLLRKYSGTNNPNKK